MDDCVSVKQSFVYDKVNRLISVTYEDGRQIKYNYDAVGNMTGISSDQDMGVQEIGFCPECGEKITPGGKFCTSCGKPLN